MIEEISRLVNQIIGRVKRRADYGTNLPEVVHRGNPLQAIDVTLGDIHENKMSQYRRLLADIEYELAEMRTVVHNLDQTLPAVASSVEPVVPTNKLNLNSSVEDLKPYLGLRGKKAMEESGIQTIGELISKIKSGEFFRVVNRNFGMTSFRELIKVLLREVFPVDPSTEESIRDIPINDAEISPGWFVDLIQKQGYKTFGELMDGIKSDHFVPNQTTDLGTNGFRDIVLAMLEKVFPDQALLVNPPLQQSFIPNLGVDQNGNPVGGINLDPALLKMQIKRDGKGMPLPVSQQPMLEMKIDGFVPVIINVTPVNLPQLLGMADSKESPTDLIRKTTPGQPAVESKTMKSVEPSERPQSREPEKVSFLN